MQNPTNSQADTATDAAVPAAGSIPETPSLRKICLLFTLVATIIFSTTITVGILLGLFVSDGITLKFHVTNALLTQFNLTTANNNNNYSILYYNLALHMTVDPFKRALQYTRIEAKAYYEDYWFSTVTLTSLFDESRKNTRYHLSFVVKGETLMLPGVSELSKFNSEKITGVYSIGMKLNLKIEDDFAHDFRTYKVKIKCALKVPLISTGISVGSFNATKCH